MHDRGNFCLARSWMEGLVATLSCDLWETLNKIGGGKASLIDARNVTCCLREATKLTALVPRFLACSEAPVVFACYMEAGKP